MIEPSHLIHAYWMLEEAGDDIAQELGISDEVILALDANSKEAGHHPEEVFAGVALGLQMGRMETYETVMRPRLHKRGQNGRRPA